jgi:uncharacterized protein (DUF3820 family)
MNETNECMPDAAVLLKLAKIRMPFGKYKEQRLIDLPEPYVVWFSQNGFPAGELGDMLRMVYEIKDTFGINPVPFDLMWKLSKITKAKAPAYLEKIASEQK